MKIPSANDMSKAREQAQISPAGGRTPHTLLSQVQAGLDQTGFARVKAGVLLPFRSVRFLVQNLSLVPFVVIPALINVALFGVVAYFLVGRVDEVVEWIWARPVIEGLFSYVLLTVWHLFWAAAVLVGLLLSYALVLLVGGLVASPFNDLLSERTEQILTGRESVGLEESFAKGMWRSVVSSAAIAGTYVAIMVPILLLNLVPGIGSAAAAVLGSAVSAFFLAMEYTDPVFSRYQIDVRRKFGLIREHLPLTGGFGVGTSVLLWIPLLNFLCMPIAVIGGTSLGLALKQRARPVAAGASKDADEDRGAVHERGSERNLVGEDDVQLQESLSDMP